MMDLRQRPSKKQRMLNILQTNLNETDLQSPIRTAEQPLAIKLPNYFMRNDITLTRKKTDAQQTEPSPIQTSSNRRVNAKSFAMTSKSPTILIQSRTRNSSKIEPRPHRSVSGKYLIKNCTISIIPSMTSPGGVHPSRSPLGTQIPSQADTPRSLEQIAKRYRRPGLSQGRPGRHTSLDSANSKTTFHSRASASSRYSHQMSQIRRILKNGASPLNNQLTLMDLLLKKHRSKQWFNLGTKKVRFFVLDFSYQKFYYKADEASHQIKFVCSFSSLSGISPFVVDREGDQPMKEPESEDVIPTEKELEKERSLQWKFGLEIYYADRSGKSSMLVVYFQTKKKWNLWTSRFDRILASNKSKVALRLNRRQTELEMSEDRSQTGQANGAGGKEDQKSSSRTPTQQRTQTVYELVDLKRPSLINPSPRFSFRKPSRRKMTVSMPPEQTPILPAEKEKEPEPMNSPVVEEESLPSREYVPGECLKKLKQSEPCPPANSEEQADLQFSNFGPLKTKSNEEAKIEVVPQLPLKPSNRENEDDCNISESGSSQGHDFPIGSTTFQHGMPMGSIGSSSSGVPHAQSTKQPITMNVSRASFSRLGIMSQQASGLFERHKNRRKEAGSIASSTVPSIRVSELPGLESKDSEEQQ